MTNGNGNAVWTRWVLGILVSIAVFFSGFVTRGQTVEPVVDLKRIELLEEAFIRQDQFNLSIATQLGSQTARHQAIMTRLDELERLIREK